MPYIVQANRDAIDEGDRATGPGELNYKITKAIVDYIDPAGEGNRAKINYALINEVIGVLECAKLELYRRVAAPYESTKLALNGDVYP